MIETVDNSLWVVCDVCGARVLWLKEKFFLGQKDLPPGWMCYKQFNQTKMIFCPRQSCQDGLDAIDPNGYDLKLLGETPIEKYPLLMGQLRTGWGLRELEKSLKERRKTIPESAGGIPVEPRNS